MTSRPSKLRAKPDVVLDELRAVEEPVSARILAQTIELRAPRGVRDRSDERAVGGAEPGLMGRERLRALGLHG